MAEAGWPRHAVRVGVFEFRRTLRDVRGDVARFGLMVLAVLVPSLLVAAGIVAFAEPLRGAGAVTLPAQGRGLVATFWLFGTFIVGQRVATARPRIDGESLVLTTVSTRTAAVGLLLAETLRALSFVAVPVVALTGALAHVFGPTASLLAVPATAALLVTSATAVGTVAGYLVVWVLATSPFVARHRTAIGGALFVAAMGAYVAMQFSVGGVRGYAALAWLPAGWLADLAVIGTPVEGSAARAGGAVLASLVVVLLGGAVVDRVTATLWFLDPVSVDDSESPDGSVGAAASDRPAGTDVAPEATTATTERANGLSAAVRPFVIPAAVPRPTRRVAEWALLRTRRDPRRLTVLLMPLFVLGGSTLSAGAGTGTVPEFVAPLAAVVLAWLAGGVFAMNPLGDEGAVLPVTLTAVDGTSYVRGLVLPGALYGTPVVLVVTAGAGVAVGLSAGTLLGLVGVAAYLAAVSLLAAPAVGMALPRFSAISVGQSREVLPPRLLAVATHALLVGVPGGVLALLVVAPSAGRFVVAALLGFLPALVLGGLADVGLPVAGAPGLFGRFGQAILAMDVGATRLAVGLPLLVGGAAVALALYRSAVARFERFEPD